MSPAEAPKTRPEVPLARPANPWLDAGVVDAGRQHDRRIFHTVFDRL
jgi:hypothetical protein